MERELIIRHTARHLAWLSPRHNSYRKLSLRDWIWRYYRWSKHGWTGYLVRVLGFQWDIQRHEGPFDSGVSILLEDTGMGATTIREEIEERGYAKRTTY